MSIITGRGDDGKTDLLFGRRVDKIDPRVEALGAVDELNAAMGWARAAGLVGEMEEVVDRVQEQLVGLMGQLACLAEDRHRYEEKGFARLREEDLEWLVEMAKGIEGRGVHYTGWARPGVEHSMAKAGLDLARAVARRAERRVWQLDREEGDVPELVKLYFNRLSDLLWLMARAA